VTVVHVETGTSSTYFRRALPGEVGVRNLLGGDGYFTIDTSLSKSWSTGIGGNRLGFRWDVFNVTNTPRLTSARCKASLML